MQEKTQIINATEQVLSVNKLTETATQSIVNPILFNEVILMSGKVKFRWQKDNGEYNGKLSLYADRVEFCSIEHTDKSFSLPVTGIASAKQRSIFLTLLTDSGVKYLFQFGSVLEVVGSAALLGGIAGIAAGQAIQAGTGINNWLPELPKLGVLANDSANNTFKGSMLFSVRIFVWIMLGATSFTTIITTIAAVSGQKGGTLTVFVVEGIILSIAVAALKYVPSGKRKL
jgi:hypothetical protein